MICLTEDVLAFVRKVRFDRSPSSLPRLIDTLFPGLHNLIHADRTSQGVIFVYA